MSLQRAGLARHAKAVTASALSLAAVTGVVYLLRPVAPDITLGVLYVFAIVPVAIVWGLAYGLPVSIASMLLFNFLFLPPLYSFTLRDAENWTVLAVYLVSAVSVSQLAALARRRQTQAEQRERQAVLLADVSQRLLRSEDVQAELREIAIQSASALGASRGRIELESLRRPAPDESAYELKAGDRHIGTLYVEAGAKPDREIAARLVPALASVIAVASDRERLGRMALEAETLRRSDSIKTAILRAVSHDLRSPLTAIRAAAEGLESDEVELTPSDRSLLLDTIAVEARRLDRLVGNLLDLSRLETGAAEPRLEVHTVDDLVARAIQELGAEGDRVTFELPSSPAVVRVDPGQIERVLVNLLENALRFSPPDTPVSIKARTVSEDEVVLEFNDSGPGLRAHEVERIFEPFLPGRSRQAGTGLGLAIVRGFVQANGGRIWVESEPGSGTTFLLALPAPKAPVRVSGPVEGVWGNREVPPARGAR